VIVTEPLGHALTSAKCTGFSFKEAEFEPPEAFTAFQGAMAKIPDLVWCDVSGEPGQHDLGLERRMRMIVSRRAKDIIEHGPHDGVIFVPGSRAPVDDEINRLLFQQAEKVAKQIYEGRRGKTP